MKKVLQLLIPHKHCRCVYIMVSSKCCVIQHLYRISPFYYYHILLVRVFKVRYQYSSIAFVMQYVEYFLHTFYCSTLSG